MTGPATDGRPFELADLRPQWADAAEAIGSIAMEIKAERVAQIKHHGWTPAHDDDHDDGALALAAACYATPEPLYSARVDAAYGFSFADPWPWDSEFDRRGWDESRGEVLANRALPFAARRRLLVKAAALIAAEIERLDRVEARKRAEAAR